MAKEVKVLSVAFEHLQRLRLDALTDWSQLEALSEQEKRDLRRLIDTDQPYLVLFFGEGGVKLVMNLGSDVGGNIRIRTLTDENTIPSGFAKDVFVLRSQPLREVTLLREE